MFILNAARRKSKPSKKVKENLYKLTFGPNFTRDMLFFGVICQGFFIKKPIALVNLSGVGTKFLNVHLVR